MQFLALNQRNLDDFAPEQFAALVPAEVQRVKELYAEGVLRQIWHRDDVPGGVLILEAQDEAAVREKLNTLPLVAAGMLRVSLTPMKPFAGFGPS